MLDDVSITVDDLGAAVAFCVAVLATLGQGRVHVTGSAAGDGPRNSADDDSRCYLSVVVRPTVRADGRHRAFRAGSRLAVDRFDATVLASGGRDHSCHAGPVPDPAGNHVEAVGHRRG